jgi:uncharacterized membrane protein
LYEQLIKRIHNSTTTTLKTHTAGTENSIIKDISAEGKEVPASESGYFQGFSLKQLLKHTVEQDIIIQFLHTKGSYILKGTPFLVVSADNIDDKRIKKFFLNIDFYYGQEIDKNSYYGFRHLMEVGVKALSPGINDPGTAVLSLNALTDLLGYKLHHRVSNVITDDRGKPRIITKETTFEELFICSVLPIWDYGKKDRLVQNGLSRLLSQLKLIDKENKYIHLFTQLMEEVKVQQNEQFTFKKQNK